MLARRDGAGVRLLTRRGIDWKNGYPSIWPLAQDEERRLTGSEARSRGGLGRAVAIIEAGQEAAITVIHAPDKGLTKTRGDRHRFPESIRACMTTVTIEASTGP
jgi:hypothetical protein